MDRDIKIGIASDQWSTTTPSMLGEKNTAKLWFANKKTFVVLFRPISSQQCV